MTVTVFDFVYDVIVWTAALSIAVVACSILIGILVDWEEAKNTKNTKTDGGA